VIRFGERRQDVANSFHSFIHSIIHSFILVISIVTLQVHYTTQRRSRLQHGYCIGVSRRSAQATVSKGLDQGPYVAARVGVEPTTLRLRVIDLTNAPPRPTSLWDRCSVSSAVQCCGCCLIDQTVRPNHVLKFCQMPFLNQCAVNSTCTLGQSPMQHPWKLS